MRGRLTGSQTPGGWLVTTVIAVPVGSSRAEVVIPVVADADTLFGATTRGLLIHLDDE